MNSSTTFYILLTSLIISACTSNQPNTTNKATATSDSTPVENLPIQTPPTTTENTDNNYQVYAGSFDDGYLHVIMRLAFTDTDVKGSYFYSKKGKEINLSGKKHPTKDLWKITETVKGKTTGSFELQKEGNMLYGKWTAPNSTADPLYLSVEALDANYNPEFVLKAPLSGLYLNEHEILDVPEDEFVSATDELQINRIDDQYLSFFYTTLCTNYHTGQISGLAKFVTSDSAVFQSNIPDEEVCILSFKFKGKDVDVTEGGDCSYYKGARAWFENSLSKK